MQCKTCGKPSQGKYDFCPHCGAYIKHQSEHRLVVPRFHRPQRPGARRATNTAAANAEQTTEPQAAATANPNGNGSDNGRAVPPPPTALIAPVNPKALSRSFAMPLRPKRRDPFPTYAGMIIFMAIWLLAILIGFGAAGVYQGLQDRSRITLAGATEHKEKAKAYIKAGNLELASEELKFAYNLNPKDPEIAELLASLQPTPAATAAATAVPPPAPPVDIPGTTYAQAKQAYDKKDYENAINALESVRRIEPGYRKQDVDELLFTAYLSLARQYLAAERWEESVQNFDKALAVRKDDNVALERYLAANYFRGLTSWQADWKRAVESFAEVVKINPKYLDAFSRLYEARIEYGDYLMERGAPCLAAEQYAAAIVMGVSGALQSKQAAASAACGATPAPTNVPPRATTAAPLATHTPPPPGLNADGPGAVCAPACIHVRCDQ